MTPDKDNQTDHDHGHSEEQMGQSPADRDMHHEQPQMEESLLESEAAPHAMEIPMDHNDHGDHAGMHTGHEQMFRRRFFVSLVLSIPVLLYSEMLQDFFGFSMPVFPGSVFVGPVFAVIIFAYGGVPFLQMAIPELRAREPGMMTLISMIIPHPPAMTMATSTCGIERPPAPG